MTANFTVATRGRRSRLKPLMHYLRRRRPTRELTESEIDDAMAAARAWQSQLNDRGGDADGR